MTEQYEAVVVGTGFGGAICACRLSKKWPGQVLVLERGKRYPMGSFPRSPHDLARNFWNVKEEDRASQGMGGTEDTHGMFDVRSFDHLDVVADREAVNDPITAVAYRRPAIQSDYVVECIGHRDAERPPCARFMGACGCDAIGFDPAIAEVERNAGRPVQHIARSKGEVAAGFVGDIEVRESNYEATRTLHELLDLLREYRYRVEHERTAG